MTLARSSALFLAARLLKTAMTLVIAWILAHALGPEGRGSYGLFILAMPFLFKASNLGVSSANAVLVAREPERLRAAVAGALWGGFGLGALVAGLAALAFPVWGPRLGIHRLDWRMAAVLASVPFGVAASQLEGILQAERRFGYVNAIHVSATAVLLAALAWLLLGRGLGLDGAIATVTLYSVLVFLLFALPYRRLALSRPDPAFLAEQLKFGFSLESVNALALGASQAASLLLNHFGIPASAIGNYFVAKGLAEQTWVAADSAVPVLISGLAGMPPGEARATAARAARVLLALQALAALAAWGAAVWLVPVFLPKYELVAPTIALLLPGVVLGVIPKALSCYAMAVGRPLTGLWVTGSGFAAASLSAFLLIPRLGIRGAVAATAIGYAAEAAAALLVFRRLSGAGALEALMITREDLRIYAGRVPRRWLKRGLLALLSLVAAAALLEGALRVLDPWGARFKAPMWRFVEDARMDDPVRGWRFRPGFEGDYGVRVRLNSLGYRGPEWPRDGRRVLVLGDSYAFGYSVPEDRVFSRALEEGLAPPFRVLNAGAIGYNTAQERSVLLDEGLQAFPEAVLVLFVRGDWEPVTASNPRSKAALEAWRRLNPVRAWIVDGHPACLDYTCLYLFHYLQWRLEFFSDVPRAALPWEPFSESDEGWKACREALAGMQDDCRARGIRFGVLLHEDEPQVRAFLEGRGIPHRALFASQAEAARHALCPIDAHPNEEGHRLIALGFLELMRGNGWLTPP